MRQISVVVAEDHNLLREALVSLLQRQKQVKVIGEAADGMEAIEKVRALGPDVILMDLKMPRMDGVAAAGRIAQLSPHTSVVVLTVSDNDEDILSAVMAGAKGYILKNATRDELLRAIEAAAAGEGAFSPPIAAKMMEQVRASARPFSRQTTAPAAMLTKREQEILRLLAKGASNKEIADALVIAESTVRGHLHRIFDKLGLQNRLQAVAYAVREGLA